jgi:hypothetical protein
MSNFNMLNQNAQESIASSVGGVARRVQEGATNRINLQENESIDVHSVNIVQDGRPEQA